VPGCPPSADTIALALEALLDGRTPDLSGQTRFGA
jgi:coenzyme F420-reducing hydrogenase gamma subunit